jgi:hypothetical protein
MAILGGLILFCGILWLVSAGLYKINITFMLILGIPFFLILWGAASGIIFAYYLGINPIRRLFVILGFAGLTVFMESLVEIAKRVEHVGKFNNIFEYFYDVGILTAFAFIIVNFLEERLKRNNSII